LEASPDERSRFYQLLEREGIVPQSNVADLMELYSAETGVPVQNNEPNNGSPGGPPASSFELHLEAVAGSTIGDSAGNYRLMVTCIDDMLAAPNATMSPGTLNQQFNTANGWMPAGPSFLKEQVFTITVPPNVAGHVFHYIATLVSDDGGIVSFIESNPFILV
jgi:hypothetical protein